MKISTVSWQNIKNVTKLLIPYVIVVAKIDVCLAGVESLESVMQ